MLDLGLVTTAFSLDWAVRSLLLPTILATVFETSLYPLGSYLPMLPFAVLARAMGLLAIFCPPGGTGRFLNDSVRIVVGRVTATVVSCTAPGGPLPLHSLMYHER